MEKVLEDQLATAMACRKLASFYRTRNPRLPMSDTECKGIANLLNDLANLMQLVNPGLPKRHENVIPIISRQVMAK